MFRIWIWIKNWMVVLDFVFVSQETRKYRKKKWHCSQYLDLNPTRPRGPFNLHLTFSSVPGRCGWVASSSDCQAGGLRFKSGFLPPLKHACVSHARWISGSLCLMWIRLWNPEERHHQKSKTGVLVAPKMDKKFLYSQNHSKFLFSKLLFWTVTRKISKTR